MKKKYTGDIGVFLSAKKTHAYTLKEMSVQNRYKKQIASFIKIVICSFSLFLIIAFQGDYYDLGRRVTFIGNASATDVETTSFQKRRDVMKLHPRVYCYTDKF